MFSGDPKAVLIPIKGQDTSDPNEGQPPADLNPPAEAEATEPKERDPLASTEEEDENAGFVARPFLEVDRLQLTVYAIENDCHIMPKGSVKLTD